MWWQKTFVKLLSKDRPLKTSPKKTPFAVSHSIWMRKNYE
jgi:hypothetical protein